MAHRTHLVTQSLSARSFDDKVVLVNRRIQNDCCNDYTDGGVEGGGVETGGS